MKLKEILAKNRKWAESQRNSDESFFPSLLEAQSPEVLWIGCSDSRVPANTLLDMLPGEVFVHRNIANQVIPSDLNCMSILQYALFSLKVRNVVVCGHYGCGGVAAAYFGTELGMVGQWTQHIENVMQKHQNLLLKIEDDATRIDALEELNVIEQVFALCNTGLARRAWKESHEFSVHGLIYSVGNGELETIDMSVGAGDVLEEIYQQSVHRLKDKYL